MKLQLITTLALLFFTYTQGKSQFMYDTTLIRKGNFEKLTFNIGEGEFLQYQVNETDIDIRNGLIESNKSHSDTIAIKHDRERGQFEIVLTDKTWSKILFGKNCSNIAKEVEHFPTLLLKRDSFTNKLSFVNTDYLKQFIRSNYTKRLNCIDTLEDQYMKKYVLEWARQIENDSIDIFTTSFSSHFAHIHALFDLLVPVDMMDTVICKVSATNSKIPIEYAYKTTKSILKDSTIVFSYTDKVEESKTLKKQIVKNMHDPFEAFYSPEEKEINQIRLASMRDEDKSEIMLNKHGKLKRYLRIMQSYVLDINLKPRYTFHNYEIAEMATSNH